MAPADIGQPMPIKSAAATAVRNRDMFSSRMRSTAFLGAAKLLKVAMLTMTLRVVKRNRGLTSLLGLTWRMVPFTASEDDGRALWAEMEPVRTGAPRRPCFAARRRQVACLGQWSFARRPPDRIPHRDRLHIRGRARPRHGCWPGRIPWRLARLDAANVDARPLVFRAADRIRLVAYGARRLQQHVWSYPHRQSGDRRSGALQFSRPPAGAIRCPRPRSHDTGRARLAGGTLGRRRSGHGGRRPRDPGTGVWGKSRDDTHLPRRAWPRRLFHGRRDRKPRLRAGRAHAPLSF